MVPPDSSRRAGHSRDDDRHRSQCLLVQHPCRQHDRPGDRPRDRPATASESGKHLAASDFSTAIKAPGTIVLDVRTPDEYAGRHLPAAQNIDIEGSDFATRIAALDKTATYAVYCHSGNRSGTALEQMSAAGFTHVFDLAGGIGAWQDMGGPMATPGS